MLPQSRRPPSRAVSSKLHCIRPRLVLTIDYIDRHVHTGLSTSFICRGYGILEC